MSNYYILDKPDKGVIQTERPDVVGTKRALKKKHGGVHGMVSNISDLWWLSGIRSTTHP
jgi:hypothetical protein